MRFQNERNGTPAGRPPGARNKSAGSEGSICVEGLSEGQAMSLIGAVKGRAMLHARRGGSQ
jgi:hypothetical protein